MRYLKGVLLLGLSLSVPSWANPPVRSPDIQVSDLPIFKSTQQWRQQVYPDIPEKNIENDSSTGLDHLQQIKSHISAYSQTPQKDMELATLANNDERKLTYITQTVHLLLSNNNVTYSTANLERSYQQGVALNFLDTLDPYKLYFSSQDIRRLTARRQSDAIQQSITGENIQWVLNVFELYEQRQEQRLNDAREMLPMVKGLIDDPKDKGDQFEPDIERWLSERKLRHRWEVSVQEDMINMLLSGKSWDEAQNHLTKTYNDTIDNIKNMSAVSRIEVFLRSYAEFVDPHSSYLAPVSKQNFQAAMHHVVSGIGVVWEKKDNDIVVREIIPQSPAQRDGRLKVGDVLIGFGPSDTQISATKERSFETVMEEFRGPSNTSVFMEIKNVKGEQSVIQLERQNIELAGQQVTSQSIKTENSSDFEALVLKIPSFYRDTSNPLRSGGSTYYDVKTILEQKKTDNTKLVVLDLRGNGGGVMTEAVSLMSLFQEAAPVVQVQSSIGERKILVSDDKEKVLWDGPMIVLIDARSASASEIAAAAFQDHNRAVVVGQRSYGKGTAQNLVDLDALMQLSVSVYGQLNVTSMMFYRPNGVSTQLVGVVPDVLIGESRYAKMNVGERSFERALPEQSIDSVLTRVAAAPWKSNLHALQSKSDERWTNSSWHSLWVSTIQEDPKSPRSLDLVERQAMAAQQKQDTQQLSRELQSEGRRINDGAGSDVVLREAIWVAKDIFFPVN